MGILKGIDILDRRVSRGVDKCDAIQKSNISQFLVYLKRGSQGGPPEIWDHCATILTHLPAALLPLIVEDGQRLLKAMYDGFNRREEPKTNSSAAWTGYLRVASHLLRHFANETDRNGLAKQAMLPLFGQYVHPNRGSGWLTGQVSVSTCISTFDVLASFNASSIIELLEAEWWRIAHVIEGDIQSSSGRQSEDFHKSQQAVASEGDRWASLNYCIWSTQRQISSVEPLIQKSSVLILETALQMLRAEEGMTVRLCGRRSLREAGEPYGVALLVESMLRENPTAFENQKAFEVCLVLSSQY